MELNRMLAYTAELDKNNDRAWFHAHHREYELARQDFFELCDEMKLAIAEVSPELGDSIMFTPAKAFMYRIPRDMRYSYGKEPYNPAFRAYFSPDKKKLLPMSYFLYLSHRGCSISGGAFTWEPEQISRLREHILNNGWELERIIAENGLDVHGKLLKRVPRGIPADHPMAEWMKYKHFIVERPFFDEELCDGKSLINAAKEAMRSFEPLRVFLSAAFIPNAPDPDFDIDERY